MKICPRCQKTFTDDNLNFCLEDGTTLQPMAAAAPPPPTVHMNQPVTNPNQPAAGQQAWNTPQQYGGPPAKKSSKTWIWVLLILGLVVLLCGGGVVGFIFFAASQGERATTSNANSTSNNRSSNSSSTNTKSSSSSRTDLTEVNLDVFVQRFTIYGTTTLDGDELTVKANSGIAYFVLADPNSKTDDTDTRMTVRAVTGSSSRGFGLVFHSNPTPLQQGYAFLIDPKRKKYSIVHHEPQKELSVVKWTSSTAINPDNAENTLEVRDGDGTIDLYINDTKVNSISNTYGYAGGVAGLYVGSGVTAAFKDLEIRR